MKYPRNVGRILTLMAILALIGVALMGCPPEEETATEPPPEDPAMMEEPVEMDDADDMDDMDDADEMDDTDETAEMDSVEVTLIDGEIQMLETLPAGMTTFVITNSGDAVHNFEIEGDGIEEVLEDDLEPGESALMEVDLEPGTYEVYCPVADHAEEGMRMTLTVTEEEADEM